MNDIILLFDIHDNLLNIVRDNVDAYGRGAPILSNNNYYIVKYCDCMYHYYPVEMLDDGTQCRFYFMTVVPHE